MQKAWKIMIFVVCLNLAIIFVNQSNLVGTAFPAAVQINATDIPSIAVKAVLGALVTVAIASIVMKESIMGGIYSIFSVIFWTTYATASQTLTQIIPNAIWLMITPLVAFAWVAAGLQLKTGGWRQHV